VGRHKGSDMPVVAQKHKEILDHWERKATPAIGNAGSVLGESTSGCPRRAPRNHGWLGACKVAAAVVAGSQLAQGGPNQIKNKKW
jgi:hypothetical protein